MNPPPVLARTGRQSVPVVFSSPHSGRQFPPDFAPAVPLRDLLAYEDRFVDELIAGAGHHGIATVCANFPRVYIDPNRAPGELGETAKGRERPGRPRPAKRARLVFRKLPDGKAIYDRPLARSDLRLRLERFWRPFHAALDKAVDATIHRWGSAWHIDWHSMRPRGNALAPDPGSLRPDFVVSDLEGRSCSRGFRDRIVAGLKRLGFTVTINHPFRGGYIVARTGDPRRNRHSLQIEINRKLYLDPETLERGRGFASLRAALTELAADVAAFTVNTVHPARS